MQNEPASPARVFPVPDPADLADSPGRGITHVVPYVILRERPEDGQAPLGLMLPPSGNLDIDLVAANGRRVCRLVVQALPSGKWARIETRIDPGQQLFRQMVPQGDGLKRTVTDEGSHFLELRDREAYEQEGYHGRETGKTAGQNPT